MRDLSKFVRDSADMSLCMMTLQSVNKKMLLSVRNQLVDLPNIQVSKLYTYDLGPVFHHPERDIAKFQTNVIYPLNTKKVEGYQGQHHLIYNMNVGTATPKEWLQVGKFCIDIVVKSAEKMTIAFSTCTRPMNLPSLYSIGKRFEKIVAKNHE